MAAERRRHLLLQVAVVLVAVHQRRTHVGQPAADAGLHRRVELDHLHEALAVFAQQRGGVGIRRHSASARSRSSMGSPPSSPSPQVLPASPAAGVRRWPASAPGCSSLLRAGLDHRLDLGQRGTGRGAAPPASGSSASWHRDSAFGGLEALLQRLHRGPPRDATAPAHLSGQCRGQDQGRTRRRPATDGKGIKARRGRRGGWQGKPPAAPRGNPRERHGRPCAFA